MRKTLMNFSFGSSLLPPEINMSYKKILVVFGATGNQGGSVINSILQDPVTAAEYQIHAVTRDPAKSSAIVLAKKGVTVLKVSHVSLEFLVGILTGRRAILMIKIPSVLR
jgi:uncharacterized protein YbjT (DUF2867 family)